MRNENNRRNERGYNLVEVLIAMALLGTVLMSILTLFVFGRRNVYSGKQITKATAVTTQILEDLQPLSVTNLNKYFKIDSSTTTGSATVGGVTYSNAVVRSTTDLSKDYTTETNSPLYLTRWKAMMPAANMSKGKVTLLIFPDDIKTTGNVTTAAIVRIRVVTEWTEARRQRSVTADVVKFNRDF